jgi:hypothetical protein
MKNKQYLRIEKETWSGTAHYAVYAGEKLVVRRASYESARDFLTILAIGYRHGRGRARAQIVRAIKKRGDAWRATENRNRVAKRMTSADVAAYVAYGVDEAQDAAMYANKKTRKKP